MKMNARYTQKCVDANLSWRRRLLQLDAAEVFKHSLGLFSNLDWESHTQKQGV